MQAKSKIQFCFYHLDKFSTGQFSVDSILTNMNTKMFLFFFTSFLASSKSSIICPNYLWPDYKNVVDGPWSFVIESDCKEPVVNLTIRRDTQY